MGFLWHIAVLATAGAPAHGDKEVYRLRRRVAPEAHGTRRPRVAAPQA